MSDTPKSLKLYQVSFTGYYPVGAYAVIIATSKEDARSMFYDKLKESAPELLEKKWNQVIPLEEFNEIFMYSPSVNILSYGEY